MIQKISLLVVAAAAVSGQTAEGPAAAKTLLGTYCQGCHNETNRSGGVSVEGLNPASVHESGMTWEKVLRKVRTGEMPPPGLPRPKAAASEGFVNWLEGELDRSAAARRNPGAPTVHRLNRAEYSNAIRDLLGLRMDHAATLPADDSGYGFDNIGSVLTVSPLLMEKYMSTARRVSRLAVGTVKTGAAVERFNPGRGQALDASDDLPLNLRSTVLVNYHFPVDAEYSITVRVRGNPPPNSPPAKLEVRIDGQRVKLHDVVFSTAEEAQITRNFEIRLPVKAGLHAVSAGYLNETLKMETGVVSRRGFGPPPVFTNVSLEYMLIGGPFNPTGPGDTESRRIIFQCRPAPGEKEEPCAQRILTTLARRAYRRPVTAADITPLLNLFAIGRKDGGSFDAGIETALRAMLVSPNFLFRVERDAASATAGTTRRVTDLELASRLSFFLWSSIPDEELLRLAEQNKLRAALPQQVRRMLADARSRSLIENFAGQWLHLRNIPSWRPDPEKFPQFDDSLRVSMQRETEMFFDYIVREDRSVLDFLGADYSFLNERLARHYGVAGVRGPHFRKVALNGSERGGVLTHASVLTVTSYPTRTSPVLRGKWILENILATPPPPPPPNVPDLEEKAANSARDLRAALEKHRASAACASCHSRLDPLGFSLENFDAVGRFRDVEDGAKVDASGSLPGGIQFDGPAGLKQVLLDRKDYFVECISEKLLTYALGRGLEHFDLPVVRQVRREAAAREHRFSEVVLAIVNSVPFQMRRTPER
jgi:mono/diheme cytochrome c family protein